jgi:hypothetical protein
MMKRSTVNVSHAAGLVMGAATAAAAGPPAFPLRRCSADAVMAGTVCLDKYEASMWRVSGPTTSATLVSNIRLGRATQADLTAGGATQLGRFLLGGRC